MAVIVALAVNWTAEGTYLKIFLIVFVVRKWIMAFLMMDRALYRLPLKLVEPDSDIDDERHNAHYMTEAPVATGVAIALSCMGLVPFFALFTMMLGALFLLYVLYILFVCMIWPFEKCGLSRRRAISRRNGGYQSDGITNTTDLRQIERAIEDVGHDESGGGGFGGTDRIKMTPAMAAIPIVIFRKRVKGVPVAAKVNESLGQLRLDVTNVIEPPDSEMTRGQLGVDDAVGITDALQSVNDDKGDTSVTDGCTGTINSASTAGDVLEASAEKQGPCDLSKHDMDHIDIPQAQGDRPVVISMSSSSNHDDAIIKLSSSLSAQRTSTIPQSHSPTTRSRASTVSFAINAGPLCASMAASPAPSMKTFIPCATLQELEEAEARLYPEITSPAGRANPGHHPRSGRHTPSIGGTVSIDIEGHSANRSQVSQSSKAVKAKRAFESDTNVLEEYCSLADEECAICLCDFEDGDELRHLYCDHLFHRGCVDRWLARHATCPKCKRSI
ncbi:hypothetical protein EDD11_005666 [Mortierella claussenii]|nr:hypothetical protein EDD11_005666 [Mortierella claussenii]